MRAGAKILKSRLSASVSLGRGLSLMQGDTRGDDMKGRKAQGRLAFKALGAALWRRILGRFKSAKDPGS